MSEKQEATKQQEPTPEQQIQELQEQYARLQAEFANYKRRTDEQISGSIQLGVGKALKAYINVIDDFTLALQNNQNPEEFHKGMEMIYAKLVSTGEELGLTRIKTVGEQFHPAKHEALLAEDSEKPEQEVLEELQAGYELNGTILRTAKVKVAK